MSRQKRGSNSEDVSQTPKSVDREIGVISVSVDKSAANGNETQAAFAELHLSWLLAGAGGSHELPQCDDHPQ